MKPLADKASEGRLLQLTTRRVVNLFLPIVVSLRVKSGIDHNVRGPVKQWRQLSGKQLGL